MQALNDALDHMDLIDIYRIFHPKVAEYTFFSSAHRTFSRTSYILDHNPSLSKFKKSEIISSICSDNHTIRLDSSNKKKTAKNTNMRRLNNILLKNQ